MHNLVKAPCQRVRVVRAGSLHFPPVCPLTRYLPRCVCLSFPIWKMGLRVAGTSELSPWDAASPIACLQSTLLTNLYQVHRLDNFRVHPLARAWAFGQTSLYRWLGSGAFFLLPKRGRGLRDKKLQRSNGEAGLGGFLAGRHGHPWGLCSRRE